ncbi:MAG: HEAT repeat domain-containing protein [Anaerolinea sp.]|nr:HEAT repeat domain-containing protein [Anaerolinea sp.]
MAGVLPALKRGDGHGSGDWTYIPTLTPGNAPLRALTKALYHQFPSKTMASIDDELWHPSGMGLTRLADLIGERVVLFIDQFEELFMPNIAEDHRQQFINLLVSAVNEPHGSLSVLLTMRADFYDRPMNYRELGELFNNHHYSVLPMSLAELREAVEYPASLPDVGLDFEPGLVGEIVFDLRDQKDKGVLAGALPLLQFTLQQLYDLRDTSRPVHQLTYEAYRSMSGVSGAIGSHAEAEYHRLDADAQDKLGYVFLQLVNVDERGEATRKRAPLNLFAEGTPERRFVDALVKARLLQTDRDEEGATLEVAHEALLRTWKRLVEWIAATAEDIRLLQKVSAAAMEWAERDRPERLLWKHEELEDVYRMLERLAPPMDDVLQEFVRPEVERLVASFKGAPPYKQLGLVDRLGEIGTGSVHALMQCLVYTDDSGVLDAVNEMLWSYGEVYIDACKKDLASDVVAVRLGAARALTRVPFRSALPALAQLIHDEDVQVRRSAIDALSTINDKRATNLLVSALKDSDRNIRYSTIDALAKIGDPHVAELLLAHDDSDIFVRRSIALALGELKAEQSVEFLVSSLNSTDTGIRYAAAKSLGSLNDERSLYPLLHALTDADPGVRSAASRSLGSLPYSRGVVNALLEALNDKRPSVRSAAASALGARKDLSVLDVLVGALKDPYAEVRSAAANALGNLGDVQAVDPLLLTLNDVDGAVRSTVVGALGMLKDLRAVEPLLTTLSDISWSVRRAAARVLGSLRDIRALEPLVLALDDPDNDVEAAAAKSLGQLGDVKAVKSLMRVFRSQYSDVAAEAAWALVALRADQEADSFLDALNSEDPGVRSAGAIASGGLKIAKALDSLISLLNDPSPAVRMSAATALGNLEDFRAISPLVQALQNDDPRVQGEAAGAIVRLRPISASSITLDGLLSRYNNRIHNSVKIVLIELKRPEDVREIVPLLDHPFVAVQQTVIEILEGMQIPEATAALEEWRSKQPLT